MRTATQITRKLRTKTKVREVTQDLLPKPEKGRESCIDYALACKEMGRYDDGLDVLNPIIHTGELNPENWKAYALAGFFNLQRGETAVCRKLMKQAVTSIGGDRTFYNCMRDLSIYNHFAYHFDFQHMQDVHDFLVKRKMSRAYLQEITVSSEGIVFISETIGRKIIALDMMGNFLWGKSLNLRKKVESTGSLSENILMSSGYGEGVTLVDNASGDVIQMDKEGSFKSMAPLGNRFFRINSFTQDYFGCIFVTEDNSMRLSIFEPDGKLQREIYLDEVMDYNSDVNPFTIIYDEEGFLHLYNIDVLLTLNGEGRKIFRKDLLTSGKAREDYKKITKGIACDSSGRIYVVRPSENRIQVIDKAHGTELGSFGPEIAKTKLVRPIDIACDLDENIYINDSGNARILKIDTSTGDVTTLFHQKHWKYLPVTR